MEPFGLLYVCNMHGPLWLVQRFYGAHQWKVYQWEWERSI